MKGPALIAAAVLVTAAVRQPATSTVRPLLDYSSIERSPFPSDRFTVADAAQRTGRRVNLPMPDCAAAASECEDRAVLNQLDGFNVQPRISVPFSGAIDPASVTSRTVFLVNLDARPSPDAAIGINQVVWFSATNELAFHPDRLLDEHTRYVLVVTTGVTDAAGRVIGAAAGYRGTAVEAAVPRLVPRGLDVAVTSVFTTQTTSHIVERLREAVQRAPAPVLNFGVGPNGARAVFRTSEIASISNNLEDRTSGPLRSDVMANAVASARAMPGATIAFGTMRTLDFTVRPSGHVPPIPTRSGVLTPTGSVDVAFNLWLPAGTRPAKGWPVAICAHGSNAGKNFCFQTAAIVASHGIAVVALHAMGHGSGPRSTMTVELSGGRSMTFASPGLGYDANGDGSILTWEPQRSVRPFAVLNTSGTNIQTAAQQLALVRAIQAGVDADGDGVTDLDASRLYYFGHSLGSLWGMMIVPFEPAIRAAAFIVPPGTLIYNTALSPPFRPQLGTMLAARSPSLLNATDGVITLDGIQVAEPHFSEQLPLRDRPPLVATVPSAAAIQRVMDHIAWLNQIASTVAAAPRLRRTPPAGIPARPFIVQAARSDPASTNPPMSEFIRAGEFADRVFFYRHDRNFGNDGVPANAHLFLSAIGAPEPYSRIAIGAQQQLAAFFESDGRSAPVPAPAELWEAPIHLPLPEDTFLMPRPRRN